MPEKTKSLLRKELKFAPTDKAKQFHYEMKEFIGNIFGYDSDGIFVSNESSLYDFLGVRDDARTIDAVMKKIRKRYGIDVAPVKDKPLVGIIGFMLEKDRSCFKK